jgi:hypothetical protein
MSTEHLLRAFYNQMYRVHTQLDNAYDLIHAAARNSKS